jgi:predicted transcriptional regulator
MINVQEIASAMEVEEVFKQNRNRRRKRQFGYEITDEGTLSVEQAFRTGQFLCIIDQQ